MDLQNYLTGFLALLCLYLYAKSQIAQSEAYKWRKRWIIERFGVGVEGEGEYFVIHEYVTGVKCIHFTKSKKEHERLGHRPRKWGQNLNTSAIRQEDTDMPNEEQLGLPENKDRDTRPWLAAGFGLCPLPQSLHEKAMAAKQKSKVG